MEAAAVAGRVDTGAATSTGGIVRLASALVTARLDQGGGNILAAMTKTIAAINVGCTNNGAGDPDANKDGYNGDGDGKGDDNGVSCEWHGGV